VLDGGVEYVQLGIEKDETYVVLTPSEARVMIVEARVSLAEWKDLHFPGVGDDITAFAGADTGATGVKNFLRYAFGLDPVNPGSSTGRPEFDMRAGRLTVSFRRPAAVTDVDYVVEVSDDLQNWSAAPAVVEQAFLPEQQDDPEISAWQTVRTTSGATKQFMRVKAVYRP